MNSSSNLLAIRWTVNPHFWGFFGPAARERIIKVWIWRLP